MCWSVFAPRRHSDPHREAAPQPARVEDDQNHALKGALCTTFMSFVLPLPSSWILR